jgi:Short C-terminal domain
MAEPIQHNGAWWHQQPDGSWLRWNEEKQVWEPWAGNAMATAQQATYAQPAQAPTQPVHHNGAWWQQQPDGSWLRWNDDTGTWEPWSGAAQPSQQQVQTASGSGDVFDQIRKLAELKDQGILSEEEFTSKKQTLLDKLD